MNKKFTGYHEIIVLNWKFETNEIKQDAIERSLSPFGLCCRNVRVNSHTALQPSVIQHYQH